LSRNICRIVAKSKSAGTLKPLIPNYEFDVTNADFCKIKKLEKEDEATIHLPNGTPSPKKMSVDFKDSDEKT